MDFYPWCELHLTNITVVLLVLNISFRQTRSFCSSTCYYCMFLHYYSKVLASRSNVKRELHYNIVVRKKEAKKTSLLYWLRYNHRFSRSTKQNFESLVLREEYYHMPSPTLKIAHLSQQYYSFISVLNLSFAVVLFYNLSSVTMLSSVKIL